MITCTPDVAVIALASMDATSSTFCSRRPSTVRTLADFQSEAIVFRDISSRFLVCYSSVSPVPHRHCCDAAGQRDAIR
jgi:hypothetical protein